MLRTSPAKTPKDKLELVEVPVILSERSFDETELSEIFQRGTDQLRRHTDEWQQTVARMRDNFVRLHPVDADHPPTTAGDVIADSETIRTLFFEYPPDAADDHGVSTSLPVPTRYQVRFDVSNFVSTSVTVTAETSTVVVRATSSTSPGQCCAARVSVPPVVLRDRLRAFLSVDGVLTVEAPLVEGQAEAPRTTSVDDHENTGSASKSKSELTKAGDKISNSAINRCNGKTNAKDDTVDGVSDKEADAAGSSTSAADATSPAEGQAGAPSKEKVGVPIFRDELGTRRMYLAVELGTIYRPRDVIIQVLQQTVSASSSLR